MYVFGSIRILIRMNAAIANIATPTDRIIMSISRQSPLVIENMTSCHPHLPSQKVQS
jgi:hypothetical protein